LVGAAVGAVVGAAVGTSVGASVGAVVGGVVGWVVGARRGEESLSGSVPFDGLHSCCSMSIVQFAASS
jgi:uncharacterized membrane protein